MREERTIGNSVIRVEKGDLTAMEGIDAFVFYARPDLQLGAGYGTAISSRGGQAVQNELDALIEKSGLVNTGDAVVTEAGRLKAKHIIHAVGPRFAEQDMEPKLRKTMQASLARAEEIGVEKLAFQPMGMNFYMVPVDMCVRVMFDEIKRHLDGETKLKEVSVITMDRTEYLPFEAGLVALA